MFIKKCVVGEKSHFYKDFEDEVVRGSIILNEGELMWPPPAKEVAAPSTPAPGSPAAAAEKKEVAPPNYFNITLKDALAYTTGS